VKFTLAFSIPSSTVLSAYIHKSKSATLVMATFPSCESRKQI